MWRPQLHTAPSHRKGHVGHCLGWLLAKDAEGRSLDLLPLCPHARGPGFWVGGEGVWVYL